MQLTADTSNPPIGVLISLKYCKCDVPVVWENKTVFQCDNLKFSSNTSICRYLAKKFPESKLYGSNIVEETEVDHWLMLSLTPLSCHSNLEKYVTVLEKHLSFKEKVGLQFITGNTCTIADFVTWGNLYGNSQWQDFVKNNAPYPHLIKYYQRVESEINVLKTLSELPGKFNKPFSGGKETKGKGDSSSKAKKGVNAKVKDAQEGTLEMLRKEEGKYEDLPGAVMGEVVVRFPPEASGYLHIGHAKAALLNQYYKEAFKGTLIMRFDDTNPAKEKVDFEKVILEDLKMLQIYPDKFTHTSDYFDLMLDLCEKMLKEGTAYVDDTDPAVMKSDREQKIPSKNRDNSPEKNLEMWEDMKKGSEQGQKCCVRAKIDMSSPNGCMRDPTIYRCKNEVHPRTGTKYKVYPTYDFACPIVDSIEGVTHCLRTMEYHDRDAQFYWFIDILGLRKPHIWEYARLNMTNTVLSKRKLTWFVENGYVQGWDDPRMSTVRGILRRGMTVEGLKQFVVAQGSSRSVVVMEWDKIWSFNKKVIDPIAPRYTAVEENQAVPVYISGASLGTMKAPLHPKNTELGEKTVWSSSKVWIDQQDAQQLTTNTNVTFINWGNIKILEIIKDPAGHVKEVKAETNLTDKDFKKTLKLTWLGEGDNVPKIPCYCVYFDHIINKPILGKDEDFKNYIGHTTQVEVRMIGDPELANVKQSQIIQLQRKGFFICDREYKPRSLHSGKESPIILFHIPDGHTKEMPSGSIIKSQADKKQQVGDVKSSAVVPNVTSILENIKKQGDIVRDLKQKKAEKAVIEQEVKKLLSYKADYKSLTGEDWKPGVEPPKSIAPVQIDASSLSDKITNQGNIVRNLKSQKADKVAIDSAVKELLNLKNEYKTLSGQDWKPQQTVNSNSNIQAATVSNKITQQGDIVRKLKAEKSSKADIDKEVKVLLDLKAEYKKLTNQDWKPGCEPAKPTTPSIKNDAYNISNKITEQGNLVRKLKSEKADKTSIDNEVKVLLELKAEYKSSTGQDWKPEAAPPPPAVNNNTVSDSKLASTMDPSVIFNKIVEQGNLVRKMKSEKASKNDIDNEVKVLLKLKSDFKASTGLDWKPDMEPPKQKSCMENDSPTHSLNDKIVEQGNLVRKLKSEKADKDAIDKEIKELLRLKGEYKTLTGDDWKPPADPLSNKGSDAERNKKDKNKEKKSAQNEDQKSSNNQKSKESKQQKQKTPPKEVNVGDSGTKKITRLGLEAKKEENLPDWYSQVITKGEMIEYYDVSGCYVLRPWSFAIWEVIRDWFDSEIKKLGVSNCYFPMFVSRSVLEKEKSHIADFAPEVAWVTKSGNSDMAEPIAIRPTSETVMYPAFAKWIQSYRDLPIRLNQWNNVVRWEFKHPQPFLRTREFLWQEGHTAFATAKEAEDEVKIILDLYAKIYTDLLAVPVVKGRKTEKEKFAGGDYTLTTEAFISASGRAIQGATSHHLGQNFSKMFEIIYEDPETQEKKYVFQNSWGITTRTIGVLIMVHADNQGLVLPPRVASIQVVIVGCGITVSMKEEEKKDLYNCCKKLEIQLTNSGIRASSDLRENYSPGWKFNHWELKGVPLRIEIGPKDIKANQIMTVRRDTGDKKTVPNNETVVQSVKSILDDIQNNLFTKADIELNTHKKLCKDWSEFCNLLDAKNLLLSPFCGEMSCEDKIKQNSARDDADESGAPAMGAKGLCIPFDQPGEISPEDKCIHPDCRNKPKYFTLFGRSY